MRGVGKHLISRNNYFFGSDIDNRCVKMTSINLCLNGLVGEVAWANSLFTKENHWGGYTILLDEKRCFVPTIKKIKPNEGYIYDQSLLDYNEKSKEQIIEKVITLQQTKLDL